jgi:hypothetical protein
MEETNAQKDVADSSRQACSSTAGVLTSHDTTSGHGNKLTMGSHDTGHPEAYTDSASAAMQNVAEPLLIVGEFSTIFLGAFWGRFAWESMNAGLSYAVEGCNIDIRSGTG